MLKKLLAPGFDRTKRDLLREIDRVIKDITNTPGEAWAQDAAGTLYRELKRILGKANLPGMAGEVLLGIVLGAVNWDALIGGTRTYILTKLRNLRDDVDKARL